MRDVSTMRTTLNIDDDVLDTVKAMASRDRKPVGEVVSAMLRRAVEPPAAAAARTRNGIPLFPVAPNAHVVTPEIVRELLEDDP
jgi:hypothetical protein